MASKLRIDKTRSITHAHIFVNDSRDSYGGGYNKGSIKLTSAKDSELNSDTLVAEFEWQRHDLRNESLLPLTERDTPYSPFDFGTTPWSKFYGGEVATTLKLDYMLSRRLATIGKVAEKVTEAIRDFNINLATDDELAQWAEALGKLGVEVVWHMRAGRTEFWHKGELPKEQHEPGGAFIRTKVSVPTTGIVR